MPQLATVRRPWRVFPSTQWAWPSGSLDQLLLAAICPDESRAQAALDQWLDENDIDTVEYRDHRLLVAIVERFGSKLAHRPEGPRLSGLQRHLWTRSRMAISQAVAALRLIDQRQIPVMLLKGAARIAADPDASRVRLAHDVDALVPPDRFAEAIHQLFEAGWTASSGESRLRLQRIAPATRAMNFFRDRFGDLDLHQWAFGQYAPHQGLQNDLWRNAQPVTFFGVPVLVPSDADRAALAIVNSGLDAHAHSDWLIDCAQLLRPNLDWDRLLSILQQSRALLPAQVAIGYLTAHVGLKAPPEFVASLMDTATEGPIRRILSLLQAKPRANWNSLTRASRGVAKQLSKIGQGRKPKPIAWLAGHFAGAFSGSSTGTVSGTAVGPLTGTLADCGQANSSADLRGATADASRGDVSCRSLGVGAILQPLVDLSGVPGIAQLRLEIVVDMPGRRRRVELELNTHQRHVARLSARSLRRRRGPHVLRFIGPIELPPESGQLWLEARPGRQLRGGEGASETSQYAALPCRVLSCQLDQPRSPDP